MGSSKCNWVIYMIVISLIFGLYVWKNTSPLVLLNPFSSAGGHKLADLDYEMSPATQVIILSYGRSGSSWVGELLNYNPNAIYYFEPLHAIYAHIMSRPLLYPSGKWGYSLRPDQRPALSKQIMEEFLNCRFDTVPLPVLAPTAPRHNWFTKERHRQLKYFRSCILRETNDTKCIPMLKAACQKATMVSFKTIRMTIRDILGILERNPGLKVVHLVRDPRAVILSITKTFLKSKREDLPPEIYALNYTRYYCGQISDNIKMHREMLGSKLSGRILDIRYEDMVKSPMLKAEEVYEFLGRPMPQEVRSFLEKSTTAPHDAGAFETSRENPIETAHKWIREITPQLTAMVEKECATGIEHFNYLPFDLLLYQYDNLLPKLE